MKLVYISHLSTNIAAGLNWSVPASVKAQSKIDEVLWVNMTNVVMQHWKQVAVYHNVSEYDGRLKTLDCLPIPFNKPDVVVFEGFYYLDDVRIAKMLREKKIPYVIIPRGSLTKLALHNHAWLKKWVAHKLFFDSFVKHAIAIQYLTKQEAADSIERFQTPYFVIPNGVNTPKVVKSAFSKESIKAVFIGRLDMFHKGIDILLDAITGIREELKKANFHLTIYGPKRYDYYKIEKEIANRELYGVVKIHNEVSGIEKEEVLLNSDLFIMTSRFEGHPMGLIEALAYGLPCMVTPGTNMYDEIRASDAGWTCQGNINEIKKTLMDVISQSILLRTKGQNARQLSLGYEWDRLAEDFHGKVTKIIDSYKLSMR